MIGKKQHPFSNRYRHLLNQNFPRVEMENQYPVGQTGSIYIPRTCSYGSAKARVDTVLTGATAERPFEWIVETVRATSLRLPESIFRLNRTEVFLNSETILVLLSCSILFFRKLNNRLIYNK